MKRVQYIARGENSSKLCDTCLALVNTVCVVVRCVFTWGKFCKNTPCQLFLVFFVLEQMERKTNESIFTAHSVLYKSTFT